MSRFIFTLIALSALACAEGQPTQTVPHAAAAALGDLVEINGAAYHRVAAKPTATAADYSLTITIPLSTDENGELYLSETITIGDKVYTSNCDGAAQDDVGNTRDTATALSVPTPTRDGTYWQSAMYQLTPGDVDYFVLHITEVCDIKLGSGPVETTTDTYGTLRTSSGREVAYNDDSVSMAPNFYLGVRGLSPGRWFLEVKGATPQAAGEYYVGMIVYTPGAGKALASQTLEER